VKKIFNNNKLKIQHNSNNINNIQSSINFHLLFKIIYSIILPKIYKNLKQILFIIIISNNKFNNKTVIKTFKHFKIVIKIYKEINNKLLINNK